MTTRSSRPWIRSSLAAAALAVNVGCYSYVPVDGTSLAAGKELRVNLSDSGSAALAPYTGPLTGAIDGRITEVNDSTLVVSVAQLTRRNGVEETWRGETVRVPRTGVASVERHQLARGRSALLVGGIAAAAAVIALSLGGGDLLGGRGSGGPPIGGK